MAYIYKEETMPKLIVTHPGAAHADETLLVSLALALFGLCRVERRDPTEEEIEDPDVLVADIGGVYDPSKNCYDHHQLPRWKEVGGKKMPTVPQCALSLWAKAQEVTLGGETHPLGLIFLICYKWFGSLITLDDRGPFEWAKANHVRPDVVNKLHLPGLPQLFELQAQYPANHPLLLLLKELGVKLIEEAKTSWLRMDSLDQEAIHLNVDGVDGFLIESSDTSGLNLWRERRCTYAPAFSVSHDDRGEGYALYRYDDDPRVRFSLLKEDPRVLFAHPGGFIAKTRERLPREELEDLLLLAMNPPEEEKEEEEIVGPHLIS